MTKHTPGPWTKKGNKIEAQQGIIAQIPMPQAGGSFGCQENAHLIAAAPELLEVCKAALPFVNGIGIKVDQLRKDIKSAIQKAEGWRL